jgi:phosphate acyltransferase
MMRIGLDVLGGDYAPKATVLGAILAYKELPSDVKLVLIGDKAIITEISSEVGFDASNFNIVHTTEFIGMGEHPAKAFSQKPNSSIGLGYHLLKSKEIDGFASAGSTGAMMVGAMYTVKSIPGIIRPALLANIPRISSNPVALIDVGLNPDCRPDVLYQYAILGSIYAKSIYELENPKVGLLNIGEEDEKGNLLTKATFQAMIGTKEFNFIGNVEANEIFSENKADVLVCDGFVGNLLLKQAEGFYSLLNKRNIKDEFFEKFNFENHGGSPVLGINEPVIVGHGRSKELPIKNMILHTRDVVKSQICEKIKAAFNKD